MLPEPARRRNRGARTAGAKAGKSEDEGGRGDGLVGEGERAEDLRDEGLGLGAGARVEGREGLALLDALADLAQARDADGRVERPDRVIVRGRTATLVDYKFGVELDSYRFQLKRYARLYRDLGYEVAGSFIWYVEEDKVVPVESFRA